MPLPPNVFELKINLLLVFLFLSILGLFSSDLYSKAGKTVIKLNVAAARQSTNDLLKYGCSFTGSKNKSIVTVVTAYYMLGSRSKHSPEKYGNWTANFFPKIQTPTVIFTDCSQIETIKDYRNGLPGVIVCYNLEDVPPLAAYADAYKDSQLELDPEKAYHYPELYFIWNAKPWYLAETAKWNPYSSEYFFWVDVGSFREYGGYSEWPDIARVESIFRSHNRQVLLGMLGCPTEERLNNYQLKDGPIQEGIIQGTFFAATADGAQWWAEEFYNLHNRFFDAGNFVGKDQEIMSVMAVLDQDKLFVIDLRHSCMDHWFFFQPFFSSDAEKPQQCREFNNWGATTIEIGCPNNL